MAEGFALNFAVFCALPALLSSCFLLTALPAQQYLASGTNRFATSREVSKALDAERALPNNTDAKASGVALCDMVDLQREVASAYVVPWHKWRC